MNNITITGLTHRQVAICELLWKQQERDTLMALVRAGGPEFQAMLDLMIAEQLDRHETVDRCVEEYLAGL